MPPKGRQPPIPLWRRTIASWPADVREDWEERAAIKEYCGGMGRDEAEKSAFDEVAALLAVRR